MQGDLTGLVLHDRYLLQERLGAGGMGEVWRCRDQRIGRDVAVKLLLDLRLSEEAVARFEREARVAGGLSSPLIVTLHDYGHGDLNGRDVPYLVMELLQGRTLAGIGNDERNSRRVLTWGAQVCAALEAAHQAGVVHRDIKPSNVMVTADGGLKVLDFGIARVAEEGTSRGPLTADGTVMGTAEYMSPEQAAGRPADARSDLYSFGCLLYFLVTARPPFQTESFFATLQLQLNGTPEPPSKYRPGLPPELDQLILQLLAKDPAARPAGARAVRETLEAMIPPPKDAGKAAGAGAAAAIAGDGAGPELAATLKDQDPVPTTPGLNAGAGNQAAVAVSPTPVPPAAPIPPAMPVAAAASGGGPAPVAPPAPGETSSASSAAGFSAAPPPSAAVPPQSGPVQPATPHQPMAPLTHPPTHVGPASETRMVPEEFGGPGTAGTGTGTGTGTTTQDPKKPGSGISRRKLLLGVGGVAGVAAVGGGVAFALGGKDSGTSGTGSQARVGANVAATGTTGATSATSATSSASSTDSPTGSGSSSSDAATSASSSAPSESGSQPPLAPGGSPIGHIEIAGQPAMSIMFMNNGKSLVVADDKNGVQIFDVTNVAGAHKVSSIDPPLSNGQLQPLNTLDYSAKRNMLALGGTGGLALWDVTDPAKPFQLCARSDVNGKKVNNVNFNSDGTKLLVATNNPDYYSDDPNGSCVLDITDPRNPAQWSGLTPSSRDTLNTAYFSRDDKYIVSTGYGEDDSNAIYQLWDSKDLHNVNPVDSTAWWNQGGGTTKLGSALGIAFAGPWHMLVVGVVSADTKSQDLQFLDFSNPLSPVKQWYVQNTSGAVAFHPTRPIVAIGDSRSGATTVYDMTDPVHPTTMTRLVADAGAVEQVAFTPDGSTLAVAVRKDGYEENAMVYFWKM